jgi:hypothetical protein
MVTDKTKIRRLPERAVSDRATIYSILDLRDGIDLPDYLRPYRR